jgi:hypothetical protein
MDERKILEGHRQAEAHDVRAKTLGLKTYTLSRKTVFNILGVIKTVVGKKVYQN